jgi:hypothetical protein
MFVSTHTEQWQLGAEGRVELEFIFQMGRGFLSLYRVGSGRSDTGKGEAEEDQGQVTSLHRGTSWYPFSSGGCGYLDRALPGLAISYATIASIITVVERRTVLH